jgi:hypothetical protein
MTCDECREQLRTSIVKLSRFLKGIRNNTTMGKSAQYHYDLTFKELKSIEGILNRAKKRDS